MIPCPGCGAGMVFDIAGQNLKCNYCGTTLDVKDAPDDRSASPDTMDVTAFTCPQCGGEILSTDNEASSFCTFCGASVMLEGRLTKARRPLYIIPFKKTKEDCKQIYGELTKKAWFAPKALKDPEYLEKFRGIYLPFWTYSFDQKGQTNLKGSRESGNYTETLALTCDLDVSYDGISYDASSAFNDDLCRFITPFNRSSMEPFLPGYMSGFYADAADVDSAVYIQDAEKDANEETFKKLKRQYPGVSIEKPKNLTASLHTRMTDVTMAMYPVWFLTYRMEDRVAYAVVNAETGKIAADLPVERKKYIIGSLILAIPIFLLLVLLPVITAPTMLLIASIMSIAAFAIFLLSSSEIKRRENRLNDKGYQAALQDARVQKVMMAGSETNENKSIALVRTVLSLIAGATGFVIWFVAPVSDIYYYGAALVIMACVCFTLLGLIKRFNLLTTRPVPEFFDRGGK